MRRYASHVAPPAELQAAQARHSVQFYEQDDFLLDNVARFLGGGLQEGDTCIAIVTELHRHGLEARLQAFGCDLPVLSETGRYVSLDARACLARIMRGPDVDAGACRDVIGEILGRAERRGRPVRVFGEMVAVLWAQGPRAAATRLEELWNELGGTYRFSVRCAYPLRAFQGEAESGGFSRVCDQHSIVLPGESYASLPSTEDRLRTVAVLQQRALSLEVEVATRRHAEEEVRRLTEELTRQLGEYAHVVRQLEASREELQDRLKDLEVFHDVAVGRELKMVDLEKEVVRLKGRSGDRP